MAKVIRARSMTFHIVRALEKKASSMLELLKAWKEECTASPVELTVTRQILAGDQLV